MQRENMTRQGGFSLIAVVFIIAVLGSIATFMVLTTGRAQLQSQQALLAARAYQAARAGLEWGIHQAVVNGNGNPAACNGASFSPAGLAEFTVNVSCTSSVHRDANSDVRVFVVNAVASSGSPGNLAYANRELRATVSPSGPL